MGRTVTAPDINGTLHEIELNSLRWRPSMYGIVIQDDTLLVSPQFRGYDLPGGGLEIGEMLEDGVTREVWEETGLRVANPRIVGVTSNFFVLPGSTKGVNVQSILLYYACDLVGGELSDANFDPYERENSRFPEWLPLSQLDSIDVASSYDWREIVKKVAKGENTGD
ncbi:MAG TPA: NUDIX domain-containing protein [Candidatus Saccharimonadales bacterium]